MTDTANWAKRGITKHRNAVVSWESEASAAISKNRALVVSGTNTVAHCGEEAKKFAGVAMDSAASGGRIEVVRGGPVVLYAGAIIEAGDNLKCWTDGSVAPYVDASESGDVILTTGNGIAFGNQPQNDGVEIVSASAADTTQSITIIGTTTATDTVVVETVALNGTSQVDTVKTDWGMILAVKLDASCAGTVTVREASANATITTILTTVLSKGVETVVDTFAGNVIPTVVCSGTSTKAVGLQGTNSAGSTIYDSQVLTNTTALAVNSSFRTVTEVYTGDLESNRTTTVAVGAVESNPATIIGVALEPAAAIADTFLAYIP